MPSIRLLATVIALFTSLQAMAADASERKFIRERMNEGEVILKIGKPDHVAVIRDERGVAEEKTWTYLPHSRDPQTLTIVTFHAGVVSRVDRKIAR